MVFKDNETEALRAVAAKESPPAAAHLGGWRVASIPIDLAVEQTGDVCFVTPSKSLDASNSLDFRLAMGPVMEENPRVALDLCNVAFVDSFGLQTIISCLRQLNAAGGDLKVCNLTPRVLLTFKLVRLNRLLEILETREQALEAFARKDKDAEGE